MTAATSWERARNAICASASYGATTKSTPSRFNACLPQARSESQAVAPVPGVSARGQRRPDCPIMCGTMFPGNPLQVVLQMIRCFVMVECVLKPEGHWCTQLILRQRQQRDSRSVLCEGITLSWNSAVRDSTSRKRLAVAGEMSTAFWKHSLAAAVLPEARCARARSRASCRALHAI